RVDCRHATIAEGRNHHGEHGDEDDGHEVAVGELLRYAVERDGSNWLYKDNTVEDQVPQRQHSPQARYGHGSGLNSGCVCHPGSEPQSWWSFVVVDLQSKQYLTVADTVKHNSVSNGQN